MPRLPRPHFGRISARLWSLDPEIAFLNHGSFGAAPVAVLREQQRLRDEMEREPVHFYERTAGPRIDAALAALASFLDAPAECLGFVTNATEGVHGRRPINRPRAGR